MVLGQHLEDWAAAQLGGVHDTQHGTYANHTRRTITMTTLMKCPFRGVLTPKLPVHN